jgi:hypothetical protein
MAGGQDTPERGRDGRVVDAVFFDCKPRMSLLPYRASRV